MPGLCPARRSLGGAPQRHRGTEGMIRGGGAGGMAQCSASARGAVIHAQARRIAAWLPHHNQLAGKAGQRPAAVGGDDDVVFDPNAELSRQVDAWLDCEGDAGR